ncbi:MAG: GNAT family N-acetyltransferase [Caldilineaceae bacterium]
MIWQPMHVILNQEGQIVGSTDAILPPPHVRNLIWARVHPAYRGRGFGTILTSWAEARIRERISEAPAGARVTADCQTVAGHQAAVDLFDTLGFTLVRNICSMKIDMTAPPPQPQWPAAITIRTMVPGQDEAALYRAKTEAFRDHWGFVETPFAEGLALWRHEFESKATHDPSLFFMAVTADEAGQESIAAYALCEPTITDFPGMAWVNNLGVRRPWRRQGLATALLHHIFGEFYRRGITTVGLGVDASSLTGATRLYEQVGMRVFRHYAIYEKELRPGHDLTTQVVHD